MNRDKYRKAFDQISFSEDFQARTVELLRSRAQKTQTSEKAQTTMKITWIRRPAAAVVAAVIVCLLAFGAAAVHYAPVVGNFFGGGAGYQQCAISVGESITQDGWTLTLTDCAGDDYSLYFGFELTAPEGTVLDSEKTIYHLDDWGPHFLNADLPGGGTGGLIDDGNPADNVLHFVFWWTYYDLSELETGEKNLSRNGQPLELEWHVGGLYHRVKPMSFEREYDCDAEWNFQTTLTFPDNTIRLEPNRPVTTLGVETAITRVEVSPIGVYVLIEGDALKGHHSWLGDKGFCCISDQEVTLHTIDGEAIPLHAIGGETPLVGASGSWCSGGEYDSDEEPRLFLSRRSGSLLDLDTLESVTVCGVEIPLR